MSVIARHRTEEFYLVQLRPGSMPAHTHGHSSGHRIEHHVQTGISVNQNVFLRHLGHIRQKPSRFRDSIHYTVIPAVHSRLALHICLAVQHIHHSIRKIKLRLGRLSSGHIQLQSLCLLFLVFLLQHLVLLPEFLFAHLSIRLHIIPPVFFHFLLSVFSPRTFVRPKKLTSFILSPVPLSVKYFFLCRGYYGSRGPREQYLY